MKRLGAGLAAAVILLTAVIAFATQIGPDLTRYESYRTPEADSTARGLTVTFLGVSTLLFDDGETAIMTDGFFTRPDLLSVVTRIRPDSALIRQALDRAQVTRLAAVIPVHSHYDHAMDAPYVARWTGAQLVGSSSTANVGRGAGLPEDRITVAVKGQPMTFGRFTVTLLESRHAPTGRFLMPGEIASPLTPPARTKDYRLGEAYSVVIRHDDRTIVVQGSAGFLPGALRDVKADVVYLGVAALGKQSAAYRDSLWQEVVVSTGAKRVIAIHWDDFTRPLSKPLRPMPRLMDDFDETMRFLLSHTGPGAPDIRIAVAFARTDPFAGPGDHPARLYPRIGMPALSRRALRIRLAAVYTMTQMTSHFTVFRFIDFTQIAAARHAGTAPIMRPRAARTWNARFCTNRALLTGMRKAHDPIMIGKPATGSIPSRLTRTRHGA